MDQRLERLQCHLPTQKVNGVIQVDISEKNVRKLLRSMKKKGDNARAGLAYEKSYELSPNPEILTKLNELYSQKSNVL